MITSSSYPVVSQVVFSMAKMIHLVMSGWFIAVNVVMTISCANAMNSSVKGTNSIVKATNSIANGTSSTSKATNSTANGTKSIVKATIQLQKTYSMTDYIVMLYVLYCIVGIVKICIPIKKSIEIQPHLHVAVWLTFLKSSL